MSPPESSSRSTDHHVGFRDVKNTGKVDTRRPGLVKGEVRPNDAAPISVDVGPLFLRHRAMLAAGEEGRDVG